jgi:hypothetical protein
VGPLLPRHCAESGYVGRRWPPYMKRVCSRLYWISRCGQTRVGSPHGGGGGSPSRNMEHRLINIDLDANRLQWAHKHVQWRGLALGRQQAASQSSTIQVDPKGVLIVLTMVYNTRDHWGFWTLSIVWYSKESNVSENDSFSVLRWITGRQLFCWVIGFFNLPNPSSRTMALGSTQPLKEMSTRNLPGV